MKEDFPILLSAPKSDDERIRARYAYDRAKSEGTKEIYRSLWKWDAYCMQAAGSAEDVLTLRKSGFVDVAYCWLRKVLSGE